LTTPQRQTSLHWIALLRVMLGLVILTTWASNLSKGYYTPDGLLNFFTTVFPQSANPLTWYAAFIDGVVLPARAAFAPFQLVAEFLVGLALLVGALTRLACLGGAFFVVNIFLATFGADWPWSYLMMLGIMGVCFFTGAGRSLGVDAWLAARWGERWWSPW
jgi:uncharacterized membrane protein YphA (DoxX/SURF4 family)